MSKIGEILSLVAIIVIAIFSFPEEVGKLFQNRFYILVGALLVFMIAFFVWLKLRTRY